MSEDTKFCTVIISQPHDLITNFPPPILQSNDYEQLKQYVLSAYEITKPELLEKQMKTTIADYSPVYLQNMMIIDICIGMNEEIVRNTFIWELPQQLAPVIATQTEMPLAELGKLSDELMPLAINNASTLQLLSNETSDKRVLPE